MIKRTRILLLIPRLQAGGAEQVMTLLAVGLSHKKYDVHLGLVTADSAGTSEMPPQVITHALEAQRVRSCAIPLLRLVWRLRPAVILSGSPEISFLVLLVRLFFPTKTRVLVRQNGTVSAVLAKGGVPRFTRLLYRLLYRRADRIICQSRAMAEDLIRETGTDIEKIVVLPNPVDLEGIRSAKNEASAWTGPGPHLLAVGRLSREKGYDLLIEAMATVRERFPVADLIIAGSGREESELKRLCRMLELQTAVRFAGRVNPPYAYFSGATLFVLSSRYEGMPNALLEAAAAGLPLIATPASGGIVALLRGRPGAWLSSSISAPALAEAIIAALESLQAGQRFCHGFFPIGDSQVEEMHADEADGLS